MQIMAPGSTSTEQERERHSFTHCTELLFNSFLMCQCIIKNVELCWVFLFKGSILDNP